MGMGGVLLVVLLLLEVGGVGVGGVPSPSPCLCGLVQGSLLPSFVALPLYMIAVRRDLSVPPPPHMIVVVVVTELLSAPLPLHMIVVVVVVVLPVPQCLRVRLRVPRMSSSNRPFRRPSDISGDPCAMCLTVRGGATSHAVWFLVVQRRPV